MAATGTEKDPEISGSNSEGDEEEEEYVVEAILKHRTTKKGTIEYFLKWKGFSDKDNTWEPAENLNCPELIEAYEKESKEKQKRKSTSSGRSSSTITSKDRDDSKSNGIDTDDKKKKKKTEDSASIPAKKKKKSEKRPVTGFDKGLEAEEILGATETSGEVHFLIKWKGVNDAELVASKLANVKIPQMVIQFYEARLTWSSSNKAAEDTEEENESAAAKSEPEEKPTPMAVDN